MKYAVHLEIEHMAEPLKNKRSKRSRIARWVTATLLLLLPLLAMQFSNEVAWDLADFMVFGTLLFGACGTYELAIRVTNNNAYRAGVAVALITAFLLIWMNLAVGMIGREDNPANLMYGGVLVTGVIGAIIARFRAHGMAHALYATALAQALVAVIALIVGWGYTLILTGLFVALWLTSARLFRKAASCAS
jgi:hypothetical protein